VKSAAPPVSAESRDPLHDWSVHPELSRADLQVSTVRPPLTPHLIHAGRVTNHMRSTLSAYSWGLRMDWLSRTDGDGHVG